MEFRTFPEVINPKINVIARLKFELANYNLTVSRISHYTTGTVLESYEKAKKIPFKSEHCFKMIFKYCIYLYQYFLKFNN